MSTFTSSEKTSSTLCLNRDRDITESPVQEIPPSSALCDPHLAEVYMQIQQLNATLPNEHKWSICTRQLKDVMMIYRTGTVGEKYDENTEYDIQCTPDDLRKIGFLRDYVKIYYEPTTSVSLSAIEKMPINPTPMEFRNIQISLKFCKFVLNRAMIQMLENITPEHFVLAMLINATFSYQWETLRYHKRPPVYFRFLAKRLFKPDPEKGAQFMETVVSRYGNM